MCNTRLYHVLFNGFISLIMSGGLSAKSSGYFTNWFAHGTANSVIGVRFPNVSTDAV